MSVVDRVWLVMPRAAKGLRRVHAVGTVTMRVPSKYVTIKANGFQRLMKSFAVASKCQDKQWRDKAQVASRDDTAYKRHIVNTRQSSFGYIP